MKGKTSSGETSQDREELEPTLSQAPESFRGYVILFHPPIHENAVLGDSADFPIQDTHCCLERSRWAPGRVEHPFPGHLLAFSSKPRPRSGTCGRKSSLLGVTFLPSLPRQQNKSRSHVSTKTGGGESCPLQFSTPARAGEANLAEDTA